MSLVSSWNVKVSEAADWLHYKGMTEEEAVRRAAAENPGLDPATFSVFRSNVNDTRSDWLAVYPDGNFPLGI